MAYENEINIVFDKDSMDRYSEYYLKHNTRAKKNPIDSIIPPLLNVFTSKVRMVQNGMKQKWKDYAIWRFNEIGLDKINTTDCEVEYHAILPTKRRADLDGLSIAAKFINDAITEYGGVWEDDCYTILKSLKFSAEYQQGVRELHIIIRY